MIGESLMVALLYEKSQAAVCQIDRGRRLMTGGLNMIHNVCSKSERFLRTLFGITFLWLLLLLPNPVGYLGLTGVVLIASAVMRYCPVSHLLGIKTCKVKQTHR